MESLPLFLLRRYLITFQKHATHHPVLSLSHLSTLSSLSQSYFQPGYPANGSETTLLNCPLGPSPRLHHVTSSPLSRHAYEVSTQFNIHSTMQSQCRCTLNQVPIPHLHLIAPLRLAQMEVIPSSENQSHRRHDEGGDIVIIPSLSHLMRLNLQRRDHIHPIQLHRLRSFPLPYHVARTKSHLRHLPLQAPRGICKVIESPSGHWHRE